MLADSNGAGSQPLWVVVLDSDPRYTYEALVYVALMSAVGGLPGESVHVHVMPGADQEAVRQFRNWGATLHQIQPTNGGSFGNNLAMYTCSDCLSAPMLVKSDLDLAPTKELGGLAFEADFVGVLQPAPSPPTPSLIGLAEYLGVSGKMTLEKTLSGDLVPLGNFNGGFVAMKPVAVEQLGRAHPFWYQRLLSDPALLGMYARSAIQVSRLLAQLETGLVAESFDRSWNFHPNIGRMDLLRASVREVNGEPRILHYGDRLTARGLLPLRGVSELDQILANVNEVIETEVLSTALGREAAANSYTWINRGRLKEEKLERQAKRSQNLQMRVQRLRQKNRAQRPTLAGASRDELVGEAVRRLKRRVRSSLRGK